MPPFNGWREGLPYYGPLLGAALVLALALRPWGWSWVALIPLAAGLAAAAFFRDFPRQCPGHPAVFYAPADGTVAAVEDLTETPHYEGPCRRISIFMSVFNAHVNRAPCAGTVRDVRYAPGRYRDARDPESSQVNESNAVWLDTEHGPVTVRQIAGAVARRIVCPAREGMQLSAGQKFGMIRFGSRVELYLPTGVHVLVKVGDRTRAGLTPVARIDTP
ncbi:MAG TPA: phosphatidylserine decarboxylase [Candidatus Hydrogenedentes bacterium]|nr:phosphatidylserine decarboxylase [Candidatus Hydrogenedentota bacterium]HPU96422.1 phosphatidylserine decarboxylase [Candidatus Hydrogenedentota bacterium]